MRRRRIRRAPGRCPGAPFQSRSGVATDECRAITRVSSSRICAKRRSGSTHVYCARGDSENRFKELKHALAFGRTSCTRFWANQLRVTLTAAAFVLFQELTPCGPGPRSAGRKSAAAGADHDRGAGRAVGPAGSSWHFPRSPSRRRLVRVSPARSAPPPRNPFLPSPPRGPAPEVSPPTTPIRSFGPGGLNRQAVSSSRQSLTPAIHLRHTPARRATQTRELRVKRLTRLGPYEITGRDPISSPERSIRCRMAQPHVGGHAASWDVPDEVRLGRGRLRRPRVGSYPLAAMGHARGAATTGLTCRAGGAGRCARRTIPPMSGDLKKSDGCSSRSRAVRRWHTVIILCLSEFDARIVHDTRRGVSKVLVQASFDAQRGPRRRPDPTSRCRKRVG